MSEDVNAVLLVTYDNAEGMLVDIWQESWLNENYNFLSLKNSEVYIKGEIPLDYNMVLSELDNIYQSYKNLIDGTEKLEPKNLAERFSSAISNLSLGRAPHIEQTEEEFRYFGKISPFYSDIFANSVTIGNNGIEMFAEKPVVDENEKKKKKRKKKKKIEYQSVEESRKVAFNICAKLLHRTCDYKNNDCADCGLCNDNTANSFIKFSDGAKNYFKSSASILTKIQAARIKRASDDIIGGQDDGSDNLKMNIDNIIDESKVINGILKNLSKSVPDINDPMYVEYNDVLDIKEAVQAIHFGLFKKYYEQLFKIFDKATIKMKKSFDAVGQGAKSSLHTL